MTRALANKQDNSTPALIAQSSARGLWPPEAPAAVYAAEKRSHDATCAERNPSSAFSRFVSIPLGSKPAAFAALKLLLAATLATAAGTSDLWRQFVLDGELASALVYPHLVHLAVPGHWTCSGTLIARGWIVTAAHSVVGAKLDHAEVSVA